MLPTKADFWIPFEFISLSTDIHWKSCNHWQHFSSISNEKSLEFGHAYIWILKKNEWFPMWILLITDECIWWSAMQASGERREKSLGRREDSNHGPVDWEWDVLPTEPCGMSRLWGRRTRIYSAKVSSQARPKDAPQATCVFPFANGSSQAC